jgi:cobyrinic acid a,c-diamide synthase
MCGALPVVADFPGPLELGYCEVTTLGGHLARGHWFHNGRIRDDSEMTYEAGNTVGSWVHLHFRSNPAVAEAFVAAAARQALEPGLTDSGFSGQMT